MASTSSLLRSLNLAGDVESRVLRLAADARQRPEQVVRRLGLVTDLEFATAASKLLSTPIVTVAEIIARSALLEPALHSFCCHCKAIPLHDEAGALTIAMADPLDTEIVEAFAFRFQCQILPRPALPSDIEESLARLYAPGGELSQSMSGLFNQVGSLTADLDRLRDEASDAPVIRVVTLLINQAVEIGASDIHVESTDGGIRTRYRVDGVLREIGTFPDHLRNAIVSRVKIMANLDIAERRLAQDGRIRQVIQGKEIDFRVSITPSAYGENIVLRILDRKRNALDFDELGFAASVLPPWLELINRPHGILLVTGPTGSGKTTTLYTALQAINSPDRKILTVEDPVEYVMAGINQTQVKPQIGLTFASVLRSFLRQDPDVIMVGEIRDLETAQIAIQASLTGHLVLSTVHTNDAASAMTRLVDMGVERYLLTSTIAGVLAQRLVRRLCSACRVAYEPSGTEVALLSLGTEDAPEHFYRATGCTACDHRGYRGRTMILELLVLTEDMRRMVLRGAEARELQAEAVRGGMRTMYADGVRKVAAGETSVEEVLRVIRDV